MWVNSKKSEPRISPLHWRQPHAVFVRRLSRLRLATLNIKLPVVHRRVGRLQAVLPNPNSKTDAGRHFNNYLKDLTTPTDLKIFCLGGSRLRIHHLASRASGTYHSSPVHEMLPDARRGITRIY